jgi:hypothetical protein
MANLTNYAEDALATWWRDGTITLPSSWYLGIASAAGEATATELAGTGYARQAVSRSLTAWSGTQGDGTTLASSGTTHRSTNNATVDFGTAGADWGAANYLILCDASTGGNRWAYLPITAPFTITTGLPVSFAAGTVEFVLGLNALSDYLANKLIDLLLRGQAYSRPGTIYGALYEDNPTSADAGTEVAGGGYGRLAIAMTSGNWDVVSGEVRLAAAKSYPSPTADWAAGLPLTHEGWRDAASLGNLLFYGALSSPLSVRADNPAPTHAAQGVILEFA